LVPPNFLLGFLLELFLAPSVLLNTLSTEIEYCLSKVKFFLDGWDIVINQLSSDVSEKGADKRTKVYIGEGPYFDE